MKRSRWQAELLSVFVRRAELTRPRPAALIHEVTVSFRGLGPVAAHGAGARRGARRRGGGGRAAAPGRATAAPPPAARAASTTARAGSRAGRW